MTGDPLDRIAQRADMHTAIAAREGWKPDDETRLMAYDVLALVEVARAARDLDEKARDLWMRALLLRVALARLDGDPE